MTAAVDVAWLCRLCEGRQR